MAQMHDLPRYCGRCGEIFDGRAAACPECNGKWPNELPTNLVACYALLLTEIQNLRARGEITEQSFRTLKRIYEERLLAVRPERRAKPAPVVTAPPPMPAFQPAMAGAMAAPPVHREARPIAPRRAAPVHPAFARSEAPPAPPKPPGHVTRDLKNWAARRQADLVLYLGAFLLSISALIFVSYQGSGGLVKSLLFGGYTVSFLLLGMLLGKWKRVQEAGPVFVAIGAILTPLNFVALYTNVLREEDVAQEWVWLAGSSATAALYSLLALRGFGKVYWLPGAVAYFAAYASLGACLQLPAEWYGPWFLALAVAGTAVTPRLPKRFQNYTEAGAYVLGGISLGFTHLAVGAEGANHAALPAAYLFATAGLAVSAFPSRRPGFLAMLPLTAVMTVASASWSIAAWAENTIAWAPAWLLAAAAGYLAIARAKPSLASTWASASLFLGAAAVVLAHLLVREGEIAWRLPAAYAYAAAIAGVWFAERRYEGALGIVPAALAAAAASAFWAGDSLAFEWLGSFAAAAGLGYIALTRVHTAQEDVWRVLAAASGALALAVSHLAAGSPDIYRWELATAYGLIGLGAIVDSFRFRGSAVAAVFAGAMGGAAALWAFEVGMAYWAFPALGIALAIMATEKLWARDGELRTMAWPSALVLAASPVLFINPYIDLPWAGAGAFAASAAVLFGLAFRTDGAFARLGGSTAQRAALLERQMFARLGCWALFASGGMVDIALELTVVESAWTFAVTGIAAWLAVAGLRKWVTSLDEVFGPVGLSAFAVAVLLARADYGHVSMIFGLGTVAAALAVSGRYANGWRVAYAGFALAAISVAHSHAVTHAFADDAGRDAWQLPAAYGLALAALLWDSAWNRYQPAMLFVPAVASLGAGVTTWWREWPDQHMAWTPLAFAIGIAATEQLWMRGAILRKAAWPYVLVLALAPLGLVEVYETEPWYGVAAFALATAAWTAACIRSNGAIADLLGMGSAEATLRERQAIAIGAFGLGIITTAYTNYALEVPQVQAAWAAAGATVASWMAIIALRRQIPTLEEVLGPASLSGVLVAVFASYPHHDHTTMILGITSIAAALTVGGKFALSWRLAYAAAGIGSLLFAHNHAEAVGTEAWQLPAAYGLVLAALLWDSARNRYQPAMLVVPALAAIGATTFAWWQEWATQHWAWAPLGISLAIAASERLWSRGSIVRQGAWPYVLVLSVVPFALLERYQDVPWAGVAAFAMATIAWGVASWRSNGAVAHLFDASSEAARRNEQQTLALAAYALGLITLGHLNFALEIPRADAAWSFAVVGAAAIALTCLRDPKFRPWHAAHIAGGTAGLALGFAAATWHTGAMAGIAGMAATVFLASGWFNRSSWYTVVGAALAAGSAALTWHWANWPTWSLALGYGAAAAALFVALAPLRKAPQTMRGAVNILSVAPIVLSVGVSLVAVFAREIDQNVAIFDEAVEQVSIVTTPEWGTLAITVVISGLMLFGEGLYRTGRRMAVLGTAVILLGLELGIAMLEIENVQVYTVPVALYLIGLGLSIRRSGEFIGTHMFQHEALFVLGAAVLVLPPAEQSFAPGGSNWGLLVIGEGLALLALGLALFQRWLAVAGVVTLVGVAGRFVYEGTASGNIPYWAMLGAAGLALLGAGVLMLLERDWWDRAKARIAAWWLEAEGPHEPLAPGH